MTFDKVNVWSTDVFELYIFVRWILSQMWTTTTATTTTTEWTFPKRRKRFECCLSFLLLQVTANSNATSFVYFWYVFVHFFLLLANLNEVTHAELRYYCYVDSACIYAASEKCKQSTRSGFFFLQYSFIVWTVCGVFSQDAPFFWL